MKPKKKKKKKTKISKFTYIFIFFKSFFLSIRQIRKKKNLFTLLSITYILKEEKKNTA